MINTQFEGYKIKRELKKSGIKYEFKRFKENEFGEPEGDPVTVGSLVGLYHETNEQIRVTTGDTTQVRTKKVPMILCEYSDAATLALKIGDTMQTAKRKFKVVGVKDVQEWGIIADISLEVIDDGLQA